MDPVSTLAFSCNILDMVERGLDCCKTFKELYKASDGLSKQRSTIIDAVDSMQSVTDDLRNTRLNVPMSQSEKGRVDQSLLQSRPDARIWPTMSPPPSRTNINKMELDLQQRSQTLHVLLMTCTRRDVSFVLGQVKGAEVQHEVRHGEAVPCKEVAGSKRIEEIVPSVGRDGDDDNNELDLENDGPGEEELPWPRVQLR
ncbi:hypothetical protein B0T26DRAFT_801370 [Lasiosphaeria miniovina]|uniref:Fungal N-terminal domain-containing protein n=1 Tax=Lasiosphaeria miniovina TaxID=1954250 RepID=A0AA40E0N8_9PEZI|nr:uncharacterized protein B0T26DRAFT_801370 [Lasiosphaeria miniovina]KAK0722645.1 hypothetical protein B0T26DRAFT_801370 [Lasiosphaeria miniovina]